MTVAKIAENLSLEILNGMGLDREVTGCYIGDLLSWVMGRAKENDAWITVMGNINAIAVARLADISCIILSENAPLDADALKKAQETGLAILKSETPAYELALALSKLLS
jgi:serine kinase of HPr protein (carbohydrate metabolism regulator)